MASRSANYFAVLAEEDVVKRPPVKKAKQPPLKQMVLELFKLPAVDAVGDDEKKEEDWRWALPFGPTGKKADKTVTALLDEAAVFEDPDVWEAMEKNAKKRYNAWLEKLEEEMEREAQEYMEHRAQFFYDDGSCCAHDRVGCPECNCYASGGPWDYTDGGLDDNRWPCW